MKPWKKLLIISLLCFTAIAFSEPEAHYIFQSVEQEQKFHHLLSELRCLVCQNQNLAESEAGLAEDLRQEIYTRVMQGMSEKDIVSYLTRRYGDFVLYRPPFKPLTYLLWVSPIIVLLVGTGFLVQLIRRRSV